MPSLELLSFVEDDVFYASLARDGQRGLLVQHGLDQAYVVDVPTGGVVAVCPSRPYRFSVTVAAFVCDDTRVLVGGPSDAVVFDAATGAQVRALDGATMAFSMDLSISPGGTKARLRGQGKDALVFETTGWSKVATLELLEWSRTEWLDERSMLSAVSGHPSFFRMELDGSWSDANLDVGEIGDEVERAISPNRTRMFARTRSAESNRGTAQVLDPRTGDLLADLPVHDATSHTQHVSFLGESRVVATEILRCEEREGGRSRWVLSLWDLDAETVEVVDWPRDMDVGTLVSLATGGDDVVALVNADGAFFCRLVE